MAFASGAAVHRRKGVQISNPQLPPDLEGERSDLADRSVGAGVGDEDEYRPSRGNGGEWRPERLEQRHLSGRDVDARIDPLSGQEPEMATMRPLRRRNNEDDVMMHNLSQATKQSSSSPRWEGCNQFFDNLGPRQSKDRGTVHAYQLHLIAQQRSSSHMDAVSFTLRYFFSVTLGRSEAIERILAPGRQTAVATRIS